MRPHPLEPVVWTAFAARDHHDSSSLGYFLAGAIVSGGAEAYGTVARDVLGYMESQGLLRRDEYGWYRPVKRSPETNIGEKEETPT